MGAHEWTKETLIMGLFELRSAETPPKNMCSGVSNTCRYFPGVSYPRLALRHKARFHDVAKMRRLLGCDF